MVVFCYKAGKIQYSSQGQSHLSELSKNPPVLMSVKFYKIKHVNQMLEVTPRTILLGNYSLD
jgi:hypothetical protein